MRLILRGGVVRLLRTAKHGWVRRLPSQIFLVWLHPGARRLHPSSIPTTCKDAPWISEQR
jgi:hypothetical protein